MNVRTEAAPAKINLFLHVCGQRADGYHLLDSLVAFATVGDSLRAEPADDLSLSVAGPFAVGLSTGEDNLVLKAARYLAARRGIPPRARLALDKRLPVASGIGGGSSDAAATLRACAALWGTTASDLDPADLAAALGADVPVCLAGRTTRMTGIGEVLAPAPALPAAAVVLVNPGAPLATAPVFKALAGRHSGPAPALPPAFADAGDLARFLGRCHNDLWEPARALLPAIKTARDALASSPGCLLARMSGSGPTCFGLFAGAGDAGAAAGQLRAGHPGWWVEAGALLP